MPEYIATNGTVTRQSFGTGDPVVYLTATITKGFVKRLNLVFDFFCFFPMSWKGINKSRGNIKG